MMLSPKRVKYRKRQRRAFTAVREKAFTGDRVSFGEFGLASIEQKWLTARQIEAARVAMTRYIKRAGKVWIRVFPDVPYTRKPAETRMGKGKGSPEMWIAVVKRGTMMFEVAGVEEETARRAMELASGKLPVKTRFVVRDR